MSDEVTIVITTKDRPRLTMLAVESARTNAPGIPLIVIDSGSTERDRTLLRSSLPEDVQFHTGSYPNAAATRNTGAKRVRTDLIGFLDSDDLMRAEKVTCLQPLLAANSAANVAIGRTAVIDQGGELDTAATALTHEWYDKAERIGTTFVGQCIRSTAFTSATLIRRSAFEQVGGYDEDLPAMEDWDLYLRLSLIGQIETARCIAADYRVWPGNVGAERSAAGTAAVAMKHLSTMPDLPEDERRLAAYALNVRAALSFQTLLDKGSARAALVAAARAKPRSALANYTFWRILLASSMPDRLITRRRASQRNTMTTLPADVSAQDGDD